MSSIIDDQIFNKSRDKIVTNFKISKTIGRIE